MKKWITTVLMVLTLMMGISLTVSAKDMEYFEEDGVQYCWVRGGSTVKPTKQVEGYNWIAVYKADGQRDTRLGICEEKQSNANHECTLFCDFNRLEYKWQLVTKEVMRIEALTEDGYVMVGAEFVLLKQKVKTNADGSYALDADGKVQYENSVTICKGIVEKDGYAKMRLDENRLEPSAEFVQLMLGQILTEEQLNMYSPLKERWYINLVKNADGDYEVYSVTEAPAVNITDPIELEASNFGKLGEGFVPEYNPEGKIFQTRNNYRVGDLIVDVAVNGFDGEIPSRVRTNITITGPDDYSKRLRGSDTLKSVRMGEYTIACSNPVSVEGYVAQTPVVTVQCPVDAEPVELTGDVKTVLLNRDHANAKININYTYTALHIHDYDDGVVTEPTCEDKGYTTYICKDPECGHVYMTEFVDAFGHDYKEEHHETTCTSDGYTLYTCTYCGDSYQVDGEPATGHTYDEGKVTKPTCIKNGYTTIHCVNEGCDYYFTSDEVPATGHHYTSVVIEPTTDREGYTLHTCSVCGDSYTDNLKDKLPSDDEEDNSWEDDSDDDSGDDSEDNGAAEVVTPTPAPPVSNNSNSGSAANATDTLIVKSVDEEGEPLSGTMVALYDGQKQLRKWACSYENVSVLDNLEKYASEGESVSLTLVQTQAPKGYEVSEDSFTVRLRKLGGKIEVDVRKSTGTGDSSVETGRDGKPIVTFCNMKKTTRIELSCEVEVEFSENCTIDETVISEYQAKQYEFVLKWKNSAGEDQTESVLLSHGDSVLMESELPFGTQYEITGTDADGNPVVGLSENASGTLSTIQVDENVAVEANLKYTVWVGEPLELSMIVVDEETGEALEGAAFELKDPDGTKIGTYFSHTNGKIYIRDAFRVTGDYLLTQTGAPEGYEPINGAAPVMVSLVCAPSVEKGTQILVQSMEAKIAHQAVSQDEDGTYRIKNISVGSAAVQTSGDGMNLGAILGIAGAAVAAVGASIAAVLLIKRKRKQQEGL